MDIDAGVPVRVVVGGSDGGRVLGAVEVEVEAEAEDSSVVEIDAWILELEPEPLDPSEDGEGMTGGEVASGELPLAPAVVVGESKG